VNVTLYGNHYGARVFHRERNSWRCQSIAEVLWAARIVNKHDKWTGGLQFTDLGFSMKMGGGVGLQSHSPFCRASF